MRANMTEKDHARANAAAWMETISQLARAMEPASWEHLEALEDAVEAEAESLPESRKAEAVALALTTEEAEELAELRNMREEYQDEDTARERAQESALSLELTGTWTPGDTPEADGFIILLTTGGPALRIVGELGRYKEPSRAWLEYQDWGTPWTEYCGENTDADGLVSFCSVFYFGE